MIIGVALLVDELHKGQRLVCRYPEAVPSTFLVNFGIEFALESSFSSNHTFPTKQISSF